MDEVVVGLIGKKGEEPEIPLSLLEEFAASRRSPDALANAILTWAKNDQPAAVPPTKSALARAIRDSDEVEDADRALRAAVPTDPDLRERLRPFVGAIRRDLRDRPTVFQPGGLVVVETPSRATAGAHYTPKSLATEVVQHALEPLVYDPGPHQQVDGWVPVDSDRILELKVADIACGSGAFLVAAARYLADRLVEAWDREEAVTGLTPAELKTHAIRTVIATCLYGADINAMAVEMCKLSLWLVSLDPKLPFSFVDDKILHGNSLLGLTDVRQLKRQHIDPDAASTQQSLFEIDVDGVLRQATRLRRQLASEVNNADPQRSVNTKRRQWHRFQEVTAELTEIADAVVATGLKLGGKPGRALNVAYENLGIALGEAYPKGLFDAEPRRTMLDEILTAGLTPTVHDGLRPLEAAPLDHRRPGRHGTGRLRRHHRQPAVPRRPEAHRRHGHERPRLVRQRPRERQEGQRRPGGLLLPACDVAAELAGNLGLIATNTVAQGDTRAVGLERMVERWVHDHPRDPEPVMAGRQR